MTIPLHSLIYLPFVAHSSFFHLSSSYQLSPSHCHCSPCSHRLCSPRSHCLCSPLSHRLCSPRSHCLCSTRSPRLCSPCSHRLCSPRSHRLCSPRSHCLCSPRSHRLCSPLSHRLCSLRSHRLCSPLSHRLCSPRSHRLCSPHSHRLCSPRSHRLCSPRSHRLCSPRSHRLCSPRSHRLCFPRSHRLCSPRSHRLIVNHNIVRHNKGQWHLSVTRGCRAGCNRQRTIRPIIGRRPGFVPTDHQRGVNNVNIIRLKPTNCQIQRGLQTVVSDCVKRSPNVALINPRSFRNKTLTINEDIIEHEWDVLAITETWLKKTGDEAIVDASWLHLPTRSTYIWSRRPSCHRTPRVEKN